MSVNVIKAVLDGQLPSEVTSARDTLVLVVLANHARPDGSTAWPSIDTIARKSRMSRRTVWTALQSLEDAGAIVRERKQVRGVQSWRVVLDETQIAYKELPEDRPTESAHKETARRGGQVGNPRVESDADCLQTVHRTVQEPPTPGGEGGNGQGERSTSAPAVVEAHEALAGLAAERGLPVPSLREVQKLAAAFPSADLVEVAHGLARDAPADLRSVTGVLRYRLESAGARPLRGDRVALLAREKANREARAAREAQYDAEYRARLEATR